MSINLIGPRAYEYQYLLTVYVALTNLDSYSGHTSMFVEHVGSEDAVLVFKGGPKKYIVDIQIKKEKDEINLKKLADWLTHFKEKIKDRNVLSQLFEKKERYYLLATEGRCNDDTKVLLSKSVIPVQRSYSKPFLSNLLESLNNLVAKKTKSLLTKERQDLTRKMILKANKNLKGLTAALDRAGIWEQLKIHEVETIIRTLLNQRFFVPQSQTSKTLVELEKIVRSRGRDAGEDIIPHIKRTVQTNSGNRPEVQANYIDRNVEASLKKKLVQKRSLLITGTSMCGKSETSKVIAGKFVDEGYAYFHTNQVIEAGRFLKDHSLEDRICLLEDPFGHVTPNEYAQESLDSLHALVSNIPSGRKLIITSNRLIFSSTLKIPASILTHDLTATKAEVISLWNIMSTTGDGMNVNLKDAIAHYIAQCPDDDIPQPGQLTYLINNQQDLKDFSRDNIRHFIALDSERLAQKLSDLPAITTDAMITLALACDTITAVPKKDLEYIFASGYQLPPLPEREPITWVMGHRETFTFPAYDEHLSMPAEYESALHDLERKGFIVYSFPNKHYTFKHPTFYEAARYLIERTPAGKFDQLTSQLQKVMDALSPQTALQGARQLRFLQHTITDSTYHATLTNLAQHGLNSLFPAVRDTCLVTMIQSYSHLSEEVKETLHSLIASNDPSFRRLRWHQQIAYVTPETSLDMSEIHELRSQLTDTELSASMKRIESGEPLFTKEAWSVLHTLHTRTLKQPVEVSSAVLERLLNFDEVFVREEAAYLIPYLITNPEDALLEKIFKDEHPFVVLEAIKGSFRAFRSFTKKKKNLVIRLIDQAFARLDVIITSTHFMTQFGIHYSGTGFDWRDVPKKDKPVMWGLWAQLLPTFFDNFPVTIRFQGPRFWATMEDSMKLLPPLQKLKIATSWLEWKVRYMEVNYVDSHLVAVVEYFFSFAHEIPSERSTLMLRLINIKNQYLAAYSLRYLIYHWKILTKEERMTLTNRIDSENIYYRATALTAKNLPRVLQKRILGEHSLQKLSREKDWKKIDIKLLHACLGIIYVDEYFEGLYFSSTAYWKRILETSITDKESTICKVAIKEMLEDHYRRFGQPTTWANVPEKIRIIIALGNESVTDFILLFIVKILSRYNDVDQEVLIAELPQHLDNRAKKYLTGLVKSNLESIDLSENLKHAFALTGNALNAPLQHDLMLIRSFKDFDTFPEVSKDLKLDFSKIMEVAVRFEKLRLPDTTFDWVRHWFSKHGKDDLEDLYEQLEKLRMKIFSIAREQEYQLADAVREKLREFYVFKPD